MACTAGRKYCLGIKGVATLTGAQATIRTRYGALCDESTGGTAAAFQVAYANISQDDNWGQSGWGRERTEGSPAIRTYRYAEVHGDDYQVNYDLTHAPADNSDHTYRCDLDPTTGTWSFYQDGILWQTYQDDAWVGVTGDSISGQGEIYNHQDSMPGTAGDKCRYSGFQQRLSGGGYTATAFAATDVESDDDHRWGAEWVSATAFQIWQK